MIDFSGRWIGLIRGTNNARLELSIQQSGNKVVGDAVINDEVFGLASFDVEGVAGDIVVDFRLVPKSAATGTSISNGEARAALQADGSMAGIWQMESETFGAFSATRAIEDGPKQTPHAAQAERSEARTSTGLGPGGVRWVPLMGEFDISPNLVTFRGRRIPSVSGPPQPSGPPFIDSVGIALCERKMVNGTVRADVRFEIVGPNTVCELILGHDLRTKGQVTAGLGGGGSLFGIREWVPGQTPQQAGGSWVNYELGGDRSNLRSGINYHLEARVQGSSIILNIDGVEVAAANLTAAPNQPRQVGIFTVGEAAIYVSNFDAKVQRPSAFIVMQFSSPYNEVYSHVIKQACDECSLEAVRADEIYGPGIIIKDVIDRIAKSQVVIADISPTNANVYFEVGYALALGKPIILLAQRRSPESPLPFDLSAFRVLFYDDSIGGKLKLEAGLREHLSQILGND